MTDPRDDQPPAGRETQLRRETRNTGAFVLCALASAIPLPFVLVGGGFAGNATPLGMAGFVVGAFLATGAFAGLMIMAARRHGDPRRAAARLAGTLTGIGVGLLLTGACYAYLNGLGG